MIDSNMKYSQLLELNRELEQSLDNDRYQAAILSNITVFQLKEILEVTLRSAGIPITATVGDFDNIVQDTVRYSSSDLVVIFWETCNLVDGLQYRIETMDDRQRKELVQRIKGEFDLVCNQLEQTSLVLFNRFSVGAFNQASPANTALDTLVTELNAYVEANLPSNFRLIDPVRIEQHIGFGQSYNLRNYYSSKALYSVDFMRGYATAVSPYIRSASGRSKKVLIFDCDNTLWKGILGEDGYDGIDMSIGSRSGRYYHEVQAIAYGLSREGILLAICSKNNAGEVEDVFEHHPDALLRKTHFAAMRINWADKATNIREISEELNVGLDSMVFVDDSPFEADIVRQQLPDVTVLQVPEKLHEYPRLLRDNAGLFYNLSTSEEDRNKTAMYRAQAERSTAKSAFANLQDYLASLGLQVTVYKDDIDQLARLSQLSLKTNQFNLTTQRYTEADMVRFIKSDNHTVFSFDVADKFGDYGITGLSIILTDAASGTATIDTLLMSCRIIGRNIELAFMNYLVAHLEQQGITTLHARYIETPKNTQVGEFYPTCSFQPDSGQGKEHTFLLQLSDYIPTDTNYIEVIDEPGN